MDFIIGATTGMKEGARTVTFTVAETLSAAWLQTVTTGEEEEEEEEEGHLDFEEKRLVYIIEIKC